MSEVVWDIGWVIGSGCVRVRLVSLGKMKNKLIPTTSKFCEDEIKESQRRPDKEDVPHFFIDTNGSEKSC